MALFKKEIDNLVIKRILIARADRLGDMVLAIPAISTLHHYMPNVEIYILANSYNKEVLKGFTFIKEVIELDILGLEEAKKKVASLKLDVFIALYSNSDIIKLAHASKAKFRIGNLSKPASFFTYNYGIIQHRKKSLKNEAEYSLDLIMQLFPKSQAIEVVKDKISYFDDNRNVVTNFVKDNNISEKFIVLHPFCAGSTPNLTIKDYQRFIMSLRKRSDIDIIITSAPKDILEAEELVRDIKRAFIFKDKTILDICALLDRASLYIGVGTGITHLAGNLDIPAVCIYPEHIPHLSSKRWGLYLDYSVDYLNPNGKVREKERYFSNVSDDFISSFVERVLKRVENG